MRSCSWSAITFAVLRTEHPDQVGVHRDATHSTPTSSGTAPAPPAYRTTSTVGCTARQVRADGVAQGGVRPHHQRHQLPAGRQHPVEQVAGDRAGSAPMTTTSPSALPSTSPGRQRPAEVRASWSATVTSAQRVRRGRLGHRDHVVPEPPRRVGDGERGQPLHRRPGGHDDHVTALVAGPVGGPAGRGDRRRGVGQHHDLLGAGAQHRVHDVGLADEDLRHAGAPGARASCVRARAGSVSIRTSFHCRPLLLRKFFAATQYAAHRPRCTW